MSELTALYQDRKSTCYWSSGKKMVISSKSAQSNPQQPGLIEFTGASENYWNIIDMTKL